MMKSPSEQVDPTNLISVNQMNSGRRPSWQGQYQLNQPPQAPHHQASDSQPPGHAQYYPDKMDIYTPVSSYPTATTASTGVEQWQVPPPSSLGISQFVQAEASPAHSTNSHYNMEHRDRDTSNAAVNSNGMSGAAAAAAAAMAAAAHTAKGSPGYPKPQNSISPHINAVHKPPSIPVQRTAPFHPNYANVQSGSQPQNVAPPPADPTIQNHSFPPAQGPHPMNRPINPSQYPHWAPPPQPNSLEHRPSQSFQHGFESQPLPTSERIPSYASDSISGPMSNASSHDSEESRSKVVSARSSSQKLSALYEPEEPGRKEFIDSVLKYWEDKDLPLKHAPMMGGRTLDLYTLYQHVRSRGFMQEVTRLKQWPEISSTMGLGSTSATGFTLKKQYCKYLYGFECRTERQEQEPQEALGRVLEANRKKKQHAEQSQNKSNEHSHYGGDIPPPGMMHHQPSMPRPPHQHHHQGSMGYHQQQMPGYHHAYPGLSHGHSVHNPQSGSYDQQPYGTMNATWQQAPHYPPNRPMVQPRYSYRPNGIPPQPGPLPPPQSYSNNLTRGRPPTQPQFNQPYPPQPPIPYNDMIGDMKAPNFRNVTPKPLPPPNITENHPASPAVKKALTENASDNALLGNTGQPMTGYEGITPTAISQDGSKNKISESTPVVPNIAASAQPIASTALSSGKNNDKPLPPMPGTPNHALLRSNTPKETDLMNTSASVPARPDFKGSPLRHGTDPPAIKRSDPGLRGTAPQYYPGSSSMGQDTFMPSGPGPYHPPPRGPERPPGPGMYQPPQSYQQSYPPYGVNSQMNDSRHYGHKRLPSSMDQFGPPNKMPRPYNSQEPQARRFSRSYRNELGASHHFQQSYGSSGHQMPGMRQYHPSAPHPAMHHSSRQAHLPMARNESPAAAVTPDPHKSRSQIAHPPESASNFLKGLVGGPSLRPVTGYYHAGSQYPPGCVEAIMSVGGKTKEKTGHEIGVVEAWQIIMSLKSGLKAESTWALNALTVLLHDGSTIGQILLSQLPGLLNLIIEHYRFCLHDLFGISNVNQLENEGDRESDIAHADAEKLTSNMAVKCRTSPSTLSLGEKELKYSPAPSKLASPYCKLPVKMVAGEDNFPLLLDMLWKDEKKPAVLDFLPISGCKNGPNKVFKSEIESNVDAKAERAEMTFEDLLSIPSFVRGNAQDKVVSFSKDEKANGNSNETSIFPEKEKKNTEKENAAESPTKSSDINRVEDSTSKSSNVYGTSKPLGGDASHIQSCLNRFAWSCDVALLEEEAAGFPGNLGFKAQISMNSWRIAARGLEHVFPKQPEGKDPELVTKVLCLSNIVRSLSCASANHNELCMHQNFFYSLCGTLLLGHKHRIRHVKSWNGDIDGCQYHTKEIKPLNLDSCSEHSNATRSSALTQNPHTNANEIKKHSGSMDPLPNSSKCETEIQNLDNKMSDESFGKISVKQEPGVNTDESSCQNDTTASAEPNSAEKIKTNVNSSLTHDPIASQHIDGTFQDPWWWECVRQLREDSLVTLANLSTTLNLARLPGEDTVLAIVDACLHWSVCPSADAQDPFPSSNPRTTLSPQSLGIEILTKLSMKESNIDLILATKPYSRLEKLYKTLTIMVGNRKNQTLREFAIVLLSNLCIAETAARSVALQAGAVSNFLSFLEECEETGLNNQRMFPAGQEMVNCGTVSYMMQRCALTLLKLAKLEENRPLFLKHHLRILSLSMSVLLGSSVQSLISAVLFELGREPPNR